MPVVNSDGKKAWIEKPILPHIFNAVAAMPGKKRYVNGIPYFEMSRANLEYVENALEDVKWMGPAAKEINRYRSMRALEVRSRERRAETNHALVELPYRHKPYDHQNKALSLARGRNAFAYFMEQGTGKTKVLLDDAADLYINGGENGKIDTLVVIAPNGVHAQWVNEQVPEHLSPVVEYSAAYTSAYPTPEEAEAMRKTLAAKGILRVVSIHIDSLSHQKGQTFLAEVLRSGRSLLVVDESSRIKDLSAKRTKAIIQAGRLAAYRRVLTGTPVTQGVEDLYSQLYFLDKNILGYDSFFAFRNHFCKMGGYQNKKITGYLNENELIEKIDAYSFRVLKDDCLDLPERNYIRREVQLHPEQRKIYEKLRKEFFLEMESGEIMTVKMAMTRLTRLQQIVSGFIWKNAKKCKETGKIIEPEIYEEFPTNRVEACLDIIRETRPETKVIVWIKFRGAYRMLTAALEKAGIGYVDYVGDTPKDQRVSNINKFRNDPNCKVFLATPGAGGIGLNLTVASEVIWFERDFSLEKELQANDRVHRIGQHRVVNYHFLVSPKTVDDKIDKALKCKQTVADTLIDIRELFE